MQKLKQQLKIPHDGKNDNSSAFIVLLFSKYVVKGSCWPFISIPAAHVFVSQGPSGRGTVTDFILYLCWINWR